MSYEVSLFKTSADVELTEEVMFEIAYESNLEECAYTNFSMGNRDGYVFAEIFNIYLTNNDYFKLYDNIAYQKARERYNSLNIDNDSLKKRIENFLNELEIAFKEGANIFFVCG